MSGFLISVGCACAVLWALEMCEISFAQSRRAGQFTYLATSFLLLASSSCGNEDELLESLQKTLL